MFCFYEELVHQNFHFIHHNLGKTCGEDPTNSQKILCWKQTKILSQVLFAKPVKAGECVYAVSSQDPFTLNARFFLGLIQQHGHLWRWRAPRHTAQDFRFLIKKMLLPRLPLLTLRLRSRNKSWNLIQLLTWQCWQKQFLIGLSLALAKLVVEADVGVGAEVSVMLQQGVIRPGVINRHLTQRQTTDGISWGWRH